MIILWATLGKAWNSAKSYGEDETEPGDGASERPSARTGTSTALGRFIKFGSRATREFGVGVDTVHPDSRNASWSTAIGDADADAKRSEGDVNVIELGVYGAESRGVDHDRETYWTRDI